MGTPSLSNPAAGWNEVSLNAAVALKAGRRYYLTISGSGMGVRAVSGLLPLLSKADALAAVGAYRIATPNSNASPWDISQENAEWAARGHRGSQRP